MNSPFRCIDTGTPLTVARSDFRRITRADAWSNIPWRDDADDAGGRDDYQIGIQAESTFLIPLGNHFVIQTITSPGLWGIDADSDDGYLDEVFADECDNLAVMLQALGVAVTP